MPKQLTQKVAAMTSDFASIYIATLGFVCVAETALIGWLIWLNTALVREAEVLNELLLDTGMMPLDRITTKAANDYRP
jgi:hypothetical protein